MQTWFGPVEDDTLRYSQRIAFLASSFEEAAELAHRYYQPILLDIEKRYAGCSEAREYPVQIVEYSADMASPRADDWDHIPDIEWVAGNLIDKNPNAHTLLLERGPDVREVAWSHNAGIRSKLTQNDIGLIFSRR